MNPAGYASKDRCCRAGSRCLFAAIASLVLVCVPGCPTAAQPVPATVDTCFVPAQACVGRIVAAIDGARREVRVEAYAFTAWPVVHALARARGRGVDVAAVLDASDEEHNATEIAALRDAGIPVWIDRPLGIAHIKAIEIDGRLVITGSYNFTWSAEHRNVEDVVFIESPAIAARFQANWSSRQLASTWSR